MQIIPLTFLASNKKGPHKFEILAGLMVTSIVIEMIIKEQYRSARTNYQRAISKCKSQEEEVLLAASLRFFVVTKKATSNLDRIIPSTTSSKFVQKIH